MAAGLAASIALTSVGLLTACGKSLNGPSGAPGSGINGVYTVRFDTTCAVLPADLRSRIYTATITNSPDILVTLTGATFWTDPVIGQLNRFNGGVTANTVRLNLIAPGEPSWGIVEQIDSTTYLEIIGFGLGSIRGSTIEGRLTAGIGFGSDLRDDSQHVGCSVGSHDFTVRFDKQ
jgi:hypothetical protein